MNMTSRVCQGRAAGTVKETINRVVAEVCTRHWSARLRSCVLTGSMARDEASFVETGIGWKALGDAEYLGIFASAADLPSAGESRMVDEEIAAQLAREGIECPTSVSPVAPEYLLGMRPHIFGYELRACGQPICGDRDVLSLIPDFGPTEIPLEDGWRLLCNRMLEMLEAAAEDGAGEKLAYRTGKLYLDMATSFLLFEGAYLPGYRMRAAKLAERVRVPAAGDPFPAAEFSRKVSMCAELKAGGAPAASFREVLSCREAVAYCRQLWRWESAILFGLSAGAGDDDLWRAALRSQGWADRIRGWAFVARDGGWLRGLRHWPHWTASAMQASPRYLVYRAAAALFFHLPELLEDGAGEAPAGVAALRATLPVDSEPGERSWRGMARAIAWNYHRFLEFTRA
jgi:hypothetical protein